MALINDPNITAQIRDLANTGTIDTTQLLSIVNSVLPAGQQITVGSTISNGIYKRFGEFDKVNAKVEVVTTGIWSGDAGQLSQFFTSSTQIVSNDGQFYWNVFDKNPSTEETAEVQFAIAYGNRLGGGATTLVNDPDNALLATRSTYAQYRAMLLDDPTQPFQFENTSGILSGSDAIYVINIGRARYREEMDAGNWEVQLSGSNGLYRFIDDSGKKFGDTFGKAGRVFKVVSGSLNIGTENEATEKTPTASNGQGYGLFYPDRGIIVFNASAIGSTIGNVTFSTGSGHTATGNVSGSALTTFNAYNQARLFSAIRNGADFDARRTENVSTQHFFVRATNREFNYSNNPTYVDVNGNFTEPSFETDPRTFITTIGLYNDSNELIAVAKTSQPIAKSFDKEILVKVKLSF
jgi:hypothetical protein